MKCSDYIVKFLEDIGIRDLFLISGGGMMHLLDSVGRSTKIKYYCNLNEQATTPAADAYAQFTNELSCCMVTTGPGGTNAVTGVVSAYIDSTPMLVISGQVRTGTMVLDSGVRQIGPQEDDIVSIVTPVTKYAVTVMDKNDIRYCLEKAVYLAREGRRGPVWVDVPLDVQGAQVEPDELRTFTPADEGYVPRPAPDGTDIDRIYELLNESKRPLFFVGNGVFASDAAEDMVRLAETLGVPATASWRAKRVFWDDHPLYFGHPGSPGERYPNFILQNCDLLIMIGSRMNCGVTAFNDRNFGKSAVKVISDIDPFEIKKIDMDFAVASTSDSALFIKALIEKASLYKHPDLSRWLTYCRDAKERFPLSNEHQTAPNGGVDGFYLGKKISDRLSPADVVSCASSGRSCGISSMSIKRQKGQDILNVIGLGSMGYTIPTSIGACIASGRRRTVCIEGDGSLQHNIQELQLIKNYSLPLKIFIYNNGGYASIAVMQDNHFESRYTACFPENALCFPPVSGIAQLYGLDYYKIDTEDEIDSVLDKIFADDRPVMCEVRGFYEFDEIPKCQSRVNADGSMSSGVLEDMFPFLDASVTAEMMEISK